jgi:hypothetical protein
VKGTWAKAERSDSTSRKSTEKENGIATTPTTGDDGGFGCRSWAWYVNERPWVGKGRLREGALRPGGRCAPASTLGGALSGPGFRLETVLAQRHHHSTPDARPVVTHQNASVLKQTTGFNPERLCSALPYAVCS